MNVGFIGSSSLWNISSEVFDNLIVLGDCAIIVGDNSKGFDSRVLKHFEWCKEPIIVKTNYKKYGKAASYMRNKEIVERCDMLYVIYDVRNGEKYLSKGTHTAEKYAVKLGKNIVRVLVNV